MGLAPASQPTCPECGSERLYRDGLRYLSNEGAVQRYICRDCGYRFSCPSKLLQKISRQNLKVDVCYKKNRQICASEGGAKNLAGKAVALTETEGKTTSGLAGATVNPTEVDVKGKILEFLWHLKRQGTRETTIKSYGKVLTGLSKQVDILQPEAVKDHLAKAAINETSKSDYTKVLRAFYKYLNFQWQAPNYKPVEKIPFIPTEQEIDLLIANTSKTISALLQLLKETGMRLGEAMSLKWTDVDFERKTVRITAEKGSLPRILPLSEKATAMLNRLPRKGERIFPSRSTVESVYYTRRKRLAHKLCNSRLLNIGFHTLRHWKVTMEYHKTKDILHVKQILGHKNINNTLIYVTIDNAIFQNATEEFHVKTAKTVEEACKLVEVGFEYVTDIEGIKIFRKRK